MLAKASRGGQASLLQLKKFIEPNLRAEAMLPGGPSLGIAVNSQKPGPP